MQHRLEEGVAHVVRFHLGNGLAFECGRADLSANLLHASVFRRILQEFRRPVVEAFNPAVREHDFAHKLGIGSNPRTDSWIDRKLKHFEDRGFDGFFGGVQRTFRGHPVLGQLAAKRPDGIGLLPALDLFFRAVAGCIRRRVAADAVRDRVQQNGPAAFQQHLFLAAKSVDHRQRIVSVHPLGMHLFRIYARADACDELHPHRLADGLPAHAVEVVHAVEDER